MFILFFQDTSFQLSNNRYVTVSEFRNKVRVDIREFYMNDEGQKKPGKKGISLSLDEWKKLKDMVGKIDKAIKKSDSSSSESEKAGKSDKSSDDDSVSHNLM